MSAEHRLEGGAGIYGKHPGFGDFIAAGLGEGWRGFADWAEAALGGWREATGPDWQARFDAGPPLCFWIGPALAGQTLSGQALRGAWLPSRDRTGRRFPLVVAQPGGAPPVIARDGQFYQAALAALTRLTALPEFDAREAVTALDLPPAQDAMPGWPTFWAVNAQMAPLDLLEQLAATDHAHAAAARSYWWFAGPEGDHAGVLACQGWPGPAELGWLIAGGQTDERQVEAGEGQEV